MHDFSWEDQAYAVVGRYCPGIERLLDDMFRETMSLTDFTYGCSSAAFAFMHAAFLTHGLYQCAIVGVAAPS